MAFEPKLNSGSLFKNTKNDLSDYNGNILVECPHCHSSSEYWLNAWKRKSQNGLAYLGIKLKAKGEKPAAAETANHNNDDDIEF